MKGQDCTLFVTGAVCSLRLSAAEMLLSRSPPQDLITLELITKAHCDFFHTATQLKLGLCLVICNERMRALPSKIDSNRIQILYILQQTTPIVKKCNLYMQLILSGSMFFYRLYFYENNDLCYIYL